MAFRRAVLALASLLAGCGLLFDVPQRATAAHVIEGSTCEPGFADCDGDPDDGCEVDLASDTSCGACGAACNHGTCRAGTCACLAPYATCAEGICATDLSRSPHDCGGCGVDCAPGACSSGRCQPTKLVAYPTTQGSTIGMALTPPAAIDPPNVYFASPVPDPQGGPTTIQRTTNDRSIVADDAPVVLALDPMLFPQELAFTGGRLLFSISDGVGSGGVASVGVDGQGEVQLSTTAPAFGLPPVVGSDGVDAFWLEEKQGAYDLARAPLLGGSVARSNDLAGFLVSSLVIGRELGLWVQDAQVARARLDGVGPAAFVPALSAENGRLAATPSRVCLLTSSPTMSGTSAVLCGDEASNAWAQVATLPLDASRVTAFMIDDANLYYAEGDGDSVVVVPTSGVPRVLARSAFVFRLIVFDRDLYWIAPEGIFRLRHPLGPE